MDAWFDAPGGLTMGTNSPTNQKCRLDTRGGISIDKNVAISAEVCILTAEHDVHSRDFHGVEEPVHIEDYFFIGTHALILPGITLGKGSVDAAGAVVTKSVEPYIIVGGVPAKPIAKREKNLEYSTRYRPFFQ